MKNKILMFAAIIGFATSCQDAIEVDQPGYRFEEEGVYDTPKDIERGLSGIYASLPGESEISFVSYFTDELGIGRDNGGQGVNDGSYRFFLDPGTSFPGSLWGSMYNIINRCNRLINRIEELKVLLPDEEYNLDISKKRLQIIRAYANLKLFSYFTPDYTNPNGLSVMKLDFVQTDDYTKYLERATVAEIVSFIESDVNDILSMEDPTEINSANTEANGYVSANFARGILVKLYSMTQEPEKLLSVFATINTNEGTALNYIQTFGSTDLEESGLAGNPDLIFRLVKIGTVDGSAVAGAWWSGSVNSADGIAYMEIGRSLYNELDKLDPSQTGNAADIARDDVRYVSTVLSTSTPVANYSSLDFDDYIDRDLLFIGKYRGSTGNNLQNDIKIMRYTDLLLCAAEAYTLQGNFDEVAAIIKRVRDARSQTGSTVGTIPTITDAQSAYKALLDERRVEFAFEGYRYLDVKRLGQRAGSDGFVRDSKDCESTNTCQLEVSSYKLTLPIPRSEILSNPVVAGQQNPNY